MSCYLPMEVEPDRSVGESASVFVQAIGNGVVPVRDRGIFVGMITCNELLEAVEPSFAKGGIRMDFPGGFAYRSGGKKSHFAKLES